MGQSVQASVMGRSCCAVGVSLVLVGVAAVALGASVPSLQVEVTKEGACREGEKAKAGDKVTVHYGGFLQDGKKFDSSFDRAQPFTFTIGVGQVIPGWDQALIGVCKGGERHLVVPPALAYGERGAGDVIPPGATLLFDVVVVDVKQVLSEAEVEEQRILAEEQEASRQEEIRLQEEIDRHLREEAEAAEQARLRKQEQKRKQEEEKRRQQELEQERQRKKEAEELDRKRQKEAEERERQRLREAEERERQKLREEQEEVRRRQEEEEEYEYEYEYIDEESLCELGNLKIETVQSAPGGCRTKARNGDKLSMHYTGRLETGRKFDSSRDRNKPFDFTLGIGQVI